MAKKGDRSKKTSIKAKLLLSLGSLVVLVGGVEIAFRLAGYGPGENKLQYIAHKDLDYIPAPDQDTRFCLNNPVHGADGLPIRINKYGQRGEDYPLEKEEGEYRVICLGDSLTFGPGVRDEETFAAVLQEIFRRRNPGTDKNVRIINAAVNGYATVHYLRWAETQVDIYDPDLLIVGCFIGNDMVIPPRGIHSIPVPMENLLRKSAFFHFLYTTYRKHLWKRTRAVQKNKAVEDVDKELAQYAGVIERDLSFKDKMRLWQHSLTHFKSIRELTRDKGVDVACALIPSSWMMLSKNEVKIYTWLEKEVEKRGYPVISLLPALQAAGKDAWLVYDPGHMNAKGHQAAAQALYDGLVKLGFPK